MSGNDVVPSEGGVLAEWGAFLKSIPGAGRAISRLVTGAADAGASWIDILKAMGEQKASAIRNDTASSAAVSKAITKVAVKRAAADGALAERAVASFLSEAIRKQESRERVAKAAIEDLVANPPPADAVGPSDDWMNRFQRYAEDVSSEEVQIMWGRVLAAEIRRPGLVSARVLRAIEEIDQETAIIFNHLTGCILGSCIIKSLSGPLDFNSIKCLIEAELILDPGFSGHISSFEKEMTVDGGVIWIEMVGDVAVGFGGDLNLGMINKFTPMTGILYESNPIVFDNMDPKIPIYALTGVGFAMANILVQDFRDNFIRYAASLAEALKPHPVFLYRKEADGRFSIIRQLNA